MDQLKIEGTSNEPQAEKTETIKEPSTSVFRNHSNMPVATEAVNILPDDIGSDDESVEESSLENGGSLQTNPTLPVKETIRVQRPPLMDAEELSAAFIRSKNSIRVKLNIMNIDPGTDRITGSVSVVLNTNGDSSGEAISLPLSWLVAICLNSRPGMRTVVLPLSLHT